MTMSHTTPALTSRTGRLLALAVAALSLVSGGWLLPPPRFLLDTAPLLTTNDATSLTGNAVQSNGQLLRDVGLKVTVGTADGFRDEAVDSRHPVRVMVGELASGLGATRLPLAPLSFAAVAELAEERGHLVELMALPDVVGVDRKSTRLNSSHT